MKRRLMDNLGTIAILLTLSGVIWAGFGFAAQVKENTYWIDEERYDRLEGRIAYKKVDCGEDAKNCSKQDQETVRRWKRQIKKLGKKLGYE